MSNNWIYRLIVGTTINISLLCFCLPFTDVSPHLVYKRCDGSHATLWPFDLPFPGDGDGDDGDGETQNEQEHEHKHKTQNNGCVNDSIHDTAESRAYFYFYFKVVPVPGYSIQPTSKMQKATIIRCLAAIWVRCNIWNRAKRVCCPMYCSRDATLACHSMCAVRFAKKNSSKRVRFCSTVAFILNRGHTHVRNAANDSDNNHIWHSIYGYTLMKNRTVAYIVRASSDSEPFWIRWVQQRSILNHWPPFTCFAFRISTDSLVIFLFIYFIVYAAHTHSHRREAVQMWPMRKGFPTKGHTGSAYAYSPGSCFQNHLFYRLHTNSYNGHWFYCKIKKFSHIFHSIGWSAILLSNAELQATLCNGTGC